MKTSLFIVVCGLLIGEDMFAQKQENASDAQISKPCETTFITIGTGLNSNYGIVGLGVDFKLMNKIQGVVSGGLGSWGFKSAGDLRYFYSGCMQSGSAVAAGLAYASGLPEMETEMELSNEETKNVTLELGAQTNLQLSWYKTLAIKEHHVFLYKSVIHFL